MPDLTTASAMLRIMSSLTLQANLFHEFQPMGGVGERFADGGGAACALAVARKIRRIEDRASRMCARFMQTFMRILVSEVSSQQEIVMSGGLPAKDMCNWTGAHGSFASLTMTSHAKEVQ